MGIRTLNVTKNAENTIIIPLFDHEGNKIISDINGKQAKIECYGRDSKAFKRALGELQKINKLISDGKEIDTPAKQDTRNINLTKAIVVGWFDVEDDGKEIEFNDENVDSLLRDEPHIMEQIDKFMIDRSKFVKKTVKD